MAMLSLGFGIVSLYKPTNAISFLVQFCFLFFNTNNNAFVQ